MPENPSRENTTIAITKMQKSRLAKFGEVGDSWVKIIEKILRKLGR